MNIGHEVILPLMFPNISQLGTHKLIFYDGIAFSHEAVLSERPHVFNLPALGALGHVELHFLTLLQALETARLDRQLLANSAAPFTHPRHPLF